MLYPNIKKYKILVTLIMGYDQNNGYVTIFSPFATTLLKVVGGAVTRSPTWDLHTTQSKYFAPTKQ